MTAPILDDLAAAMLTATGAEPLAVGSGPETGQRRDAFDFVPGSVVRGALAARWIRRHGPPDRATEPARQEFLDLFERGTVRFGPLYPHGYGPRWMSVFEHKYARPPTCDNPDIDRAHTPDVETPVADCPRCGSGWEPAKGGVAALATPITPLHVDGMHTEIGADGRPVDGNLFIRRSIAAGTRLTGLLTGPTEALRRLLDDDEPLILGGNRTASGRITLHHATTAFPPVPRVIGDQLILRLFSPAIFIDRYGRPSLRPDLDQLSDTLDVPVVAVTRQWTRSTLVGGWHVASGLPKPVERVAITGSVYVLRCARTPTPDALARLARAGVGLRRHEGFGWVSYPDRTTTP